MHTSVSVGLAPDFYSMHVQRRDGLIENTQGAGATLYRPRPHAGSMKTQKDSHELEMRGKA